MLRLRSGCLFVALLVVSGCARTQAPASSEAAAALPVVAGAESVDWARDYDGTVRYEVDDAYPARRSIEFITTSLEARGWVKAEEDLFNAGSPLFGRAGWRSAGVKTERVVSWAGQWLDPLGNRALYYLSYRGPDTIPVREPSGPLLVHAIYISAERATNLRASVGTHLRPIADDPLECWPGHAEIENTNPSMHQPIRLPADLATAQVKSWGLLLKLCIAPKGNVERVIWKARSGNELVDRFYEQELIKRTFTPVVVDGHAISTVVNVSVTLHPTN